MAEDVFGIVGSVIASAYHVESVVAEGRLGPVYRAQRAADRAPVALQLLELPAQNPQQHADFLRLFRRQAELLIRFAQSQPNVARALHADAFTSKDGRFVPYLVLEWLEGMTFEALILQRKQANLGPVPLRKLVRLLTPVARALEHAQAFDGPDGPVSIVHGDLKPADLFITQVAGEELVKLLDLGTSKLKCLASQAADARNQDGTGRDFTLAYGAPEQWAPRHYGQAGPRTDVWGLALCLVEIMAARPVIVGEPATMMSIVLDAKRRPTPRTEGIDLPDALEAVFARALALEPRARQAHVGIFWNELVAALERSEAIAERADALEFDPSSVRRPTAAPARVSQPYTIPMSAPARAPSGAPAGTRAAAISPAHFVPDLELAPPSAARPASGERPVARSVPAPAPPTVLDLDSVSMPVALELDLDLPVDEPRAQRSVSSQRLSAVQPSALRSSYPPPGLGVPISGVISTRPPSSDSHSHSRAGDPARSARNSRPPRSAEVSASFDAGFVAKIDPKQLAERSLSQRLRPAIALLGTAILLAIFDPIYAAMAGEVLEIAGQRLSLLAGALLVLALGLAVREVTRAQ